MTQGRRITHARTQKRLPRSAVAKPVGDPDVGLGVHVAATFPVFCRRAEHLMMVAAPYAGSTGVRFSAVEVVVSCIICDPTRTKGSGQRSLRALPMQEDTQPPMISFV